jgi:glutamate transport system permease protein
VLPQLEIRFSYFSFALIALTIYHAVLFCEAIRSGINSVAVGQAEAARSIGLTFLGTLRLVVLPQALRTVIPPLINVVIILIKNTAVASAFGVTELLSVMELVASEESQAVMGILLTTGCIYLAMTIPAGLLAAHIERKVAFGR